MPRATDCNRNGDVVSIDMALQLRNARRTSPSQILDFQCIECGQTVRPHKAGAHGAAHFEHSARNPNCPLSDPAR